MDETRETLARRDAILAETQADWDEFKRFDAAVETEVQAMRLSGCTCPETYTWHFAGCIWAVA